MVQTWTEVQVADLLLEGGILAGLATVAGGGTVACPVTHHYASLA